MVSSNFSPLYNPKISLQCCFPALFESSKPAFEATSKFDKEYALGKEVRFGIVIQK